jgi:hypothetical protein
MFIWYILQPFGILYSHLVYFTAIRYILWLFGIFSPVLVCCSKKNLAALTLTGISTFKFDCVAYMLSWDFRRALAYT